MTEKRRRWLAGKLEPESLVGVNATDKKCCLGTDHQVTKYDKTLAICVEGLAG